SEAGIPRVRAVQSRRGGTRRGPARAGGTGVYDARVHGRIPGRRARSQAARLSRIVSGQTSACRGGFGRVRHRRATGGGPKSGIRKKGGRGPPRGNRETSHVA